MKGGAFDVLAILAIVAEHLVHISEIHLHAARCKTRRRSLVSAHRSHRTALPAYSDETRSLARHGQVEPER